MVLVLGEDTLEIVIQVFFRPFDVIFIRWNTMIKHHRFTWETPCLKTWESVNMQACKQPRNLELLRSNPRDGYSDWNLLQFPSTAPNAWQVDIMLISYYRADSSVQITDNFLNSKFTKKNEIFTGLFFDLWWFCRLICFVTEEISW